MAYARIVGDFRVSDMCWENIRKEIQRIRKKNEKAFRKHYPYGWSGD